MACQILIYILIYQQINRQFDLSSTLYFEIFGNSIIVPLNSNRLAACNIYYSIISHYLRFCSGLCRNEDLNHHVLINYGLCKNKVLYRHACICVFAKSANSNS